MLIDTNNRSLVCSSISVYILQLGPLLPTRNSGRPCSRNLDCSNLPNTSLRPHRSFYTSRFAHTSFVVYRRSAGYLCRSMHNRVSDCFCMQNHFDLSIRPQKTVWKKQKEILWECSMDLLLAHVWETMWVTVWVLRLKFLWSHPSLPSSFHAGREEGLSWQVCDKNHVLSS